MTYIIRVEFKNGNTLAVSTAAATATDALAIVQARYPTAIALSVWCVA